MNIFKTVFLLLIIFLCSKAYTQDSRVESIDTLAGHFIKNLRIGDPEKIFLQTDKSYYIAGEDLWFTAYCINAISHKVFRHSKTVFADLVNDNDSVIAQLLLNNRPLKLEGKISLSSSLPEGYYWIRAYTRNMLKRDTNSICVQPIYIFNAKKPANLLSVKNKKDANESITAAPEVIFFPEGGSLISGTNSIVAFRAADNNGNPIDISGYITDNRDSVVAQLKTSMPGLGKFSVNIWKSRKYTAHIKWNGNKEYTYALPLVNQLTSQLSVIEQTDNYVHVQVSLGDSIYNKNTPSYILGISRDSLCFAAIGNDMYDFTIPKDNFPGGKATLVLFDDKQKIVSERCVYVNRKNSEINITTDKEKYGTRDKVNLTINVTNSEKKPTVALMSLSVTDDNLSKQFTSENIPDEIMNDDIKFPFDFTGTDSMQNFSLAEWDLIMMTQKSNFIGKQFKNENDHLSINHEDAEDDLNKVNGRILNKKGEPEKNMIVTLLAKKTQVQLKADTTNESGEFHFTLPEYNDSTKFVLQVSSIDGEIQHDKIVIYPFESPNFSTPEKLKKRFPLQETQKLKTFKTNQLDTVFIGTGKGWLKPVTIRATRKKELNYDESKRLSKFSHILTPDQFDLGGIDNIANVLLTIPGVHMNQGLLVIGGQDGFNLSAYNEPLLVVNGIAIDLVGSSDNPRGGGTDELLEGPSPLIAYLRNFSPGSVELVEVLTGPDAAMYGVRGGHGVISITTSTKSRDETEFVGLMRYTPKGYFKTQEFTEPDYSKKEFKNSSEPDERSTIFWNGNVFTNNNGNASEYFFTSDSRSVYTVTVFGVTANGDVFSKKIKIKRE